MVLAAAPVMWWRLTPPPSPPNGVDHYRGHTLHLFPSCFPPLVPGSAQSAAHIAQTLPTKLRTMLKQMKRMEKWLGDDHGNSMNGRSVPVLRTCCKGWKLGLQSSSQSIIP